MQEYRLQKSVLGYKPLYCLDDRIIIGNGNGLFSATLDLENIEYICELPEKTPLSRFRLFERIFRGGIQTIALLDRDTILAVCKSKIWKVSLLDGSFTLDFEIPGNKKLLNLTKIIGINGFNECICFGEYFNNPHMEYVRIWSRPLKSDGQWNIVHTFDKGQINHIHNIIPDPSLGAAWVLAGDFEQGASMWLANENFKYVKSVIRGDQTCRAVWMQRVKNNEYCYATDSQINTNSFKKLIYSDNSCQTEQIVEIEGSSIYATAGNNVVVFSTAVEPGVPTGIVIRDIFETKPGAGIKSKYACIYVMDGSYRTREIFRAKKDLLPFRLAQFGTFMFPGGKLPQGYIYAYGVGVKNFDNVCMVFKAIN